MSLRSTELNGLVNYLKREDRMGRDSAAYLREEAKRLGTPVPHVCGARGFGYSADDICPTCEDERKK